VWYPFSTEYQASRTPLESLNGPIGVISVGDVEDRSRCLSWGTVNGDSVSALDEIPLRPVWESSDEVNDHAERGRADLEREWDEWTSSRDEKCLRELERVVKIASGQDFLLALKGNGEVWHISFRNIENANTWEYVCLFVRMSWRRLTNDSYLTSHRLPLLTSPPNSRQLLLTLPRLTRAPLGLSL